jgi:hypothetical protein
MTGSAGWLETRHPTPPADLRDRLGSDTALKGVALVDHLVAEAVAALDRARAGTGRVRESALDLLVADAFFTYACEAALELPDPDEVLARIVEAAADAR